MDILEKQKFIFGSLFLLANKLQLMADKHLEGDGITTKQWFLTAAITQFGDNPPTLSEVADAIGSSRQNVKQLALKLEDNGFLNIQKDEKDSRALRLVLTEKSQEFWHKRESKDYQFIINLFEGLSREEVTTMAGALAKLLKTIEDNQ